MDSNKISDTNKVSISGFVKEMSLGEAGNGTPMLEMRIRVIRVRTKRGGSKFSIPRLFPVVKFGEAAREQAAELEPGQVIEGFGYLDSQLRDAVDENDDPLYKANGEPGKSWQPVIVLTKITVRKPARKQDGQAKARSTEATPVEPVAPTPSVEPPAAEASEAEATSDAPLATEEAGTRVTEPPATPVEEAQADGHSEPDDEVEEPEAGSSQPPVAEEEDEVQEAGASGSESPVAGGDTTGEQVSPPAQTQLDVGPPQGESGVFRNDDPAVKVTNTAIPLVEVLEAQGVSRSKITATGEEGADGRKRLTKADAKKTAKENGLNVTQLVREAAERSS